MNEIVECLRTLKEPLQTETLPRYLVDDLWSICFLSRIWAVEKDGMLRRNDLIQEEDIALLDEWITEVSLAVLSIFDGSPDSAEDTLISANTLTQTHLAKEP